MSDLFLGIADPEFWRNCGYALLAIGLIGTVAVILLLDRKPRLQKGLALLFLAVVLAGLGVARFGNNALLSEARERAREAELELAKLKTPRTLTPEAQRRVAAALQNSPGRNSRARSCRDRRMRARCGKSWTRRCAQRIGSGWRRRALRSAILPPASRSRPTPA
jgi:hypothetical protein